MQLSNIARDSHEFGQLDCGGVGETFIESACGGRQSGAAQEECVPRRFLPPGDLFLSGTSPCVSFRGDRRGLSQSPFA